MERKQRLLSTHLTLTANPMGVFRWRAMPDAPYERVLETDFWDTVCDRFSVREQKHQGQIIEVLPQDCSYYAELIAIKLSSGQVRVEELFFKKLGQSAQAVAGNRKRKREDYEVKLRGPRRWSILRASDQKIMFEDITTQEEANTKLDEYIGELAA